MTPIFSILSLPHGNTAHQDLSETIVNVLLDEAKLVALIKTEANKFDLEYLRIEEPVTLRKRANGTKLTWIGYKGEPNHALIRTIVTAQAWVEEIKAGRSISNILHAQNIPEGAVRQTSCFKVYEESYAALWITCLLYTSPSPRD